MFTSYVYVYHFILLKIIQIIYVTLLIHANIINNYTTQKLNIKIINCGQIKYNVIKVKWIWISNELKRDYVTAIN